MKKFTSKSPNDFLNVLRNLIIRRFLTFEEKIKKHLKKYWQLGFLGFLGFLGIPELLTQDWLGAIWIVWFVWFTYFIPIKKR